MNRVEKLAIDYVRRCHDDMVTASKGPGLKALEAQEFISFIKIAYEAGYYQRELNESLDAIKAIFPKRQSGTVGEFLGLKPEDFTGSTDEIFARVFKPLAASGEEC